ncbi:unnamed protein product, partial [Amoebophrya sp. A120]
SHRGEQGPAPRSPPGTGAVPGSLQVLVQDQETPSTSATPAGNCSKVLYSGSQVAVFEVDHDVGGHAEQSEKQVLAEDDKGQQQDLPDLAAPEVLVQKADANKEHVADEPVARHAASRPQGDSVSIGGEENRSGEDELQKSSQENIISASTLPTMHAGREVDDENVLLVAPGTQLQEVDARDDHVAPPAEEAAHLTAAKNRAEVDVPDKTTLLNTVDRTLAGAEGEEEQNDKPCSVAARAADSSRVTPAMIQDYEDNLPDDPVPAATLDALKRKYADLGAGSACLTESPDDFDLSSFLSSPAELPLRNQEPEINQTNTTNELAAADGVQFDGHSQRASEGAQEELLASPSVHQREATTPGDVDATSGAARQQRA